MTLLYGIGEVTETRVTYFRQIANDSNRYISIAPVGLDLILKSPELMLEKLEKRGVGHREHVSWSLKSVEDPMLMSAESSDGLPSYFKRRSWSGRFLWVRLWISQA